MALMKRGSAMIHYEWMNSENPDAEDTLILIHGLGMDMYSWDYSIPYFIKNYHIMWYDLRGHGESGHGGEKNIMGLLRDDLALLISELKIQSYHIVGHGLGGFPGVQLASEKAKGLKSLVLMSVPIHYPKQLGNKVSEARKGPVEGHETMLAMGEQLMNNAFYPPTEEKVKILLDSFQKVTPAVYFDIFHIDNLKSGIERLRKIDVPILLLSGAEDEMFPAELAIASLNFITNSKHYTVPQASFMIQMDQPKMMADWIHSFVQGNNNKKAKKDDYHAHLISELYSEINELLHEEEEHPKHVNELQVNMMNGFHVHINGQRVLEGWGKRKAKQILVYLVFQQSATREELCDMFWPDVLLEHARNRLRVSLHHLKQLLTVNNDGNKAQLLGSEREHVFLQAKVQSDLLYYTHAIKKAHQLDTTQEKAEEYKRLLRERTENVMAGFFENWFLDLRGRLESEWAEMALFLVDLNEADKDYHAAVHYIEIALNYHFDEYELSQRLFHLKEQMAAVEKRV